MDPEVQKLSGRIQPREMVESAVARLRGAGIHALNFDLMYGLPEQSVEDVRRTARFAASLDPARIAMFGYAHVPWFKVHQRLIDAAALPGSGERLAQAQAARDTLAAAGFEAIGLDHFARADDPLAVAAREGRLRRNFQGYVADEADALLGFGPSAIGRAPQGFAQNAVDVAGWRRLVEAGSLAAARGVAISPEDRLRSQAIERLMCDFELDYGALAARVAGDPAALDDAAGRLDELAAMGVLAHEGRRVRVTMAGRPFARLAAAAFDAYLSQGAARHSASV
jgi:oxygen-independent coproporphyrinogen-3 oxidase